ncbi:MAG: hypothetical protein ACRC8J_10000 [Phocaeicola sp.]
MSNNDKLKELFNKLPDDNVKASFRANVMLQVVAEANRIKKRNERWVMFATATASLFMVALAIVTLSYMNVTLSSIDSFFKEFIIEISNAKILNFYLFIAFLAMILLFLDYKIRDLYNRRKERSGDKVLK